MKYLKDNRNYYVMAELTLREGERNGKRARVFGWIAWCS